MIIWSSLEVRMICLYVCLVSCYLHICWGNEFFPTRFLHSCVRPRWDDPKAVWGDWGARFTLGSCNCWPRLTLGNQLQHHIWKVITACDVCSHWGDHFDFDRCYINDCNFQQFHQRAEIPKIIFRPQILESPFQLCKLTSEGDSSPGV